MKRFTMLAMLLMISIIISGCVAITRHGASMGRIQESNDVTRAYKLFVVNPEYNYFYYGAEFEPDAILAIEKSYAVKSRFWKPIQLTEEQLKTWVIWGQREDSGESFSRRYSGYQGAYILDPKGKVIGDWYSKKDTGVFYFPSESEIVPYPPTNEGGSPANPCV